MLFSALLLAAAPQHFEVIASEPFNYPAGVLGGLGAGSGTGWLDVWYSGSFGDNAFVTSPGHDPVGGMAVTRVADGGSWRTMRFASFEDLVDNGLFGKDGTTIWVRFTSRRVPGTDDDYGGLSLYIRFQGEQLFLGSPSFTNGEWGWHDIRFHPAPRTVPGSSSDVLTRLVYRIDFLPGSERIRLWLDPTSDHPTSAPDLDDILDDFRFNEIRLQSGTPITSTGYEFDGIVIDTPAFRPLYSVRNPVAGQIASLDLVNATPGDNAIFAYSLHGPGPINSPYGLIWMDPPITQLNPHPVNAQGEVHVNVTVPPSVGGRTVWSQAFVASGPGSGVLSNPLEIQVP